MENLTEQDIIRELKYGKDDRNVQIRQTVIRMQEEKEQYDELIACASLQSPHYREARAENRSLSYDRITDVSEEARKMMKECQESLAREVRAICRSEQKSRDVWGSFRRLDHFHRSVLHRYYVDKESSRSIADSLNMSESTFWRKRKEAIAEMLKFCGDSRDGEKT